MFDRKSFSMRTTKKQIQGLFARFVEIALRGQVATSARENDAYSYDYNPYYGGYVVTRYCHKGSGEGMPLGETRMSASEFVRCMHFAIQTACLIGDNYRKLVDSDPNWSQAVLNNKEAQQ